MSPDESPAPNVSQSVIDLARCMLAVRDEWQLDDISVSRIIEDGHLLTLRWAGPILELTLNGDEYVELVTQDIVDLIVKGDKSDGGSV